MITIPRYAFFIMTAALIISSLGHVLSLVKRGVDKPQVHDEKAVLDSRNITTHLRCVDGKLEAATTYIGGTPQGWGVSPNLCEIIPSTDPLKPTDALRVKLLNKETCPAHCICPTTKQLDVCLVTKGMLEKDLKHARMIASAKEGCTQLFAWMQAAEDCHALLKSCQSILERYSAAVDRAVK